MQSHLRSLFIALTALALTLAACAPAATPSPEAPAATSAPAATAAPETTAADPLAMYAPSAVSGDIISAGSSTVFPLTERMAELFQNEGYTGNITVDSIGSGAGFERFCKTGETDISNASRAIKSSEMDACKAIGREPLEFRVGTDALSVVVSSQNDFLTAISLEDLAKIFSGQAKLWSDLNPAYPAKVIQVFSPGADSGTFDYFVEAVLAPAFKNAEGKADAAAAKTALLGLAGAQFSEDDNVLVQGVEGSKYAIGYFGYAYYLENAANLKALAVNGVEPNQANVDNGTYPLARPLFIYSTAKIMQEKPQVAAFIYFYLNNLAANIQDAGYFPAPAEAEKAALDAWTQALGK